LLNLLIVKPFYQKKRFAMITENNFSENEENNVPQNETTEKNTELETTITETVEQKIPTISEETPDNRSVEDLVEEMEKSINQSNAGADLKSFNEFKALVLHKISEEKENKKHAFESQNNGEELFSWEHPLANKISGIIAIFKEKHTEFVKHIEEVHEKSKEERHLIIERLKKLNANSEPGTNLFKEIREIKKSWTEAGQVSKTDFNTLNNDYFHHLKQFYEMLDMHKEYLEQEYAHNLEKRQHIIERAKELEKESSIQKALNELQFLHKLWKEEAEPVSEEFKDKTWNEFKEISNRIHERKAELAVQIEAEQNAHLEKKNAIIAEITEIVNQQGEKGHQYWQNAIKKIEDLRAEFLKTGNVPRKSSNENWNAFKNVLKNFNNAKNVFYKSLKSNQNNNLEAKLKLIQTANDNKLSEDWEMVLPLYKKLQDDWKNIGHVPRNMSDKIWTDFREACNAFFNNYREKKKETGDNWRDNLKLKKQLLEDLKTISNEEGSVEKIESIKTEWNAIGKVPRDKMTINSEFNKTLRDKLKLNKINEFDLKEEGLTESQLTDKARKMKNQISDMESEIAILENNLGFFSKPSRENPLLADTYHKIDEKKAVLESMKEALHQIISGE
jgi:hypothetical protein